MKIKSMTDVEIASFNLTVSTLQENLKSLREVYNAVEDGIDELEAAKDAIEVDVDDDVKKNFDILYEMYEVYARLSNALADLEELVDELELAEKDEDHD